jgi:hypothetical protein
MRKYEILFKENPLEWCKILSLRIPMHLTHLSNVARGKDFVNKSAKLSPHLLRVHVGKTISEKYIFCN